MDTTEAIVSKLELEAQRRGAQAVAKPWPREHELSDVREQISDLTRAWRAKRIKGARYFPMLADLERDETELERDRADWHVRVGGTSSRPVAIRTEWPSKTLAEQRAFAQSVLVAVIVKPAGRGRRFDPERLDPVWVEE